MSQTIATPRDLIVVSACRQIEATITGILTRTEALGIRKVDAGFIRHPNFDSGCCRTSQEFLRAQIHRFNYALVVFDHEGSGRENEDPIELGNDVRGVIERNGWGGRVEVIAIVPELETWVWSQSPRVERHLGWSGSNPGLREWLAQEGLLNPGELKPRRPKEALEKALEEKRMQRSSSLYLQLASTVALKGCSDSAMAKLCETLKKWFPNPGN